MSRARVLLAVDTPHLQAMVAGLVAKKFAVVGVVNKSEQILAEVALAQPDVVVLDLPLRGSRDLGLFLELRRRYPLLAIVMLTAHAYPLDQSEALDANVPKRDAFAELFSAITESLSSRRAKHNQRLA